MAPCLVGELGRAPVQGGGAVPGVGLRAPSSHCHSLRPSALLSTLGCPAKKNVCDSNTCHNGGTCVNQWDAFSCQCPLGFGGKSCAQGRSAAIRGQGPGAVSSAGNTLAGSGQTLGRAQLSWAVGGKACQGRAPRGQHERQRAQSEAGLGTVWGGPGAGTRSGGWGRRGEWALGEAVVPCLPGSHHC